MAGIWTKRDGTKRRARKISRAPIIVAGVLGACTGLLAAPTETPKPATSLAVTIDARQTAMPTSKYEFGMFIEHIGPLIYRSLWSEMLDDRKFYFPITAENPEAKGRQQGFP